jgi:phytoene synthase
VPALSNQSPPPACAVWSFAEWAQREQGLRVRAVRANNAWSVITRQARAVLRAYSTSFFIVTRFLPPVKRAQVEAIYAAVRYPDELVDTFLLAQAERLEHLRQWQEDYEGALRDASLEDSLQAKRPCFVAAFAEVVRRNGIPPEHYRAFLDAMRRDVTPQPFATLDELIDNYIYGSAIVVGYFLAHVYGATTPADWPRALASSRALGIALQLTNFLRDVGEDARRGRVYLPVDMLCAAGVEKLDANDPQQQEPLRQVVRQVAGVAEEYYAQSEAQLDAFAADSRLAISACIKVYRRLNERIRHSERGVAHRESVPAREKFSVLPPSKYWRIPLAYLLR